jgi:hypothetical protein
MYFVDTVDITIQSIKSVTGSDVFWNYKNVIIDENSTINVSVLQANSTPFASDFQSSTKAISMNEFTTFFNSTATERVSQGFVLDIPELLPEPIPAKFASVNQCTLMTYPFLLTNSISDSYEGEANYPNPIIPILPIPLPFLGKNYTTFDGQGTLVLPGDSIYNVSRLEIIDTATIDLSNLQMGSMQLIRRTYEYYKLDEQRLPIFIDFTFEIHGDLQGQIDIVQRQVYSKYLSIDEPDDSEPPSNGINEISFNKINIFPNPSNGSISLSGEFKNAYLEIFDLTGKKVYNSEILPNSLVNLNIENGIYNAKIINENNKITFLKLLIK